MNKHHLWIDNVKALALLGVIVVHVAGVATPTEFRPDSSNNITWWIANIYASFFRFCVPLFVMVTGTLLLPQKQMPLTEFLKKRLRRVLLPFIFWTFVYIVFNVALKFRSGTISEITNPGRWFFSQIIEGAWPHLWYVYMIIGLYLFIPVIKPWVQQASNKAILFFLGIWLVSIIINQQTIFLFESDLDLRYFTGYLGYLLLGYFISERMMLSSLVRKLSVLAFLIGYLFTVIGTFLVTRAAGVFSHAFYENLTVNVLLMSAGLFIFLRSLNSDTTNKAFNGLRELLSRYGFGIYLAHGIVLSTIIHFKIDYDFINPWLAIPISSVLCLALTTLLVYLLDKLPYGKYISR